MKSSITVRPMTFSEFDAYQDFVDDLTDKGVKANKVSRQAAIWIMRELYKVDANTSNLTPGKIMDIVTKTIEATFRVEEEAEKN